MTRQQWALICKDMVANWPNADWKQTASAGSLDKWFADLSDLDPVAVSDAVEVLYRSGERFPPNGGQIRKQVAELTDDLPDFDQVWARLWEAAARFGRDRGPEAFAWLDEWRPGVGQFAERLPWRQFCLTETPEVFAGQARRAWENTAARQRRDRASQDLDSRHLPAIRRSTHELPALRPVADDYPEGEPA